MASLVHLTEPLPDARASIECESAELRGNVVWLDPVDDDHIIVPIENLAGIEGGTVDREVDHLPTQGGQYSEVVTRVS